MLARVIDCLPPLLMHGLRQVIASLTPSPSSLGRVQGEERAAKATHFTSEEQMAAVASATFGVLQRGRRDLPGGEEVVNSLCARRGPVCDFEALLFGGGGASVYALPVCPCHDSSVRNLRHTASHPGLLKH